MPSDSVQFRCNICGRANRRPRSELSRESPSCSHCGSNVRTRGLLQALSLELFGMSLALPDFPYVKSLRGLGISDDSSYAYHLDQKLDYRNTFYDQEPRFDIANPPEDEFGRYDFLISSEVFEHVPPPVETAFSNAFRLLKPSGVLVFTVPYSLEPAPAEHFPELHEFGLAQLGDKTVLVNRTREGKVQVFENIVFHGGRGATVEMREFTEQSLKAALTGAGFRDIRIYSENYGPFGIVRSESWSLPIAGRKGPGGLSPDATRDVLEQWWRLKRLEQVFWFRLGRKLGFLR
ncbi:MAG TPA: methyltransferase domain-containing protein [Bryobacteraceae bacterium]|nr:methyltransferase domain-containing protein [Bryobacteraceae bacterium]